MAVLSGMALGLGISLFLKPLIVSQLFGVQVFDGFTLSLASLSLLATALIATFVPASRATRVDPMVGLRRE